MANTCFLRDWLWFYQNGGRLYRYSNVDKTSRLNLTVKEAMDNYKIDRSLVNGLPDNEMIVHDSIRFENILGGVGNSGYINTVESINEDLVIIGGKFNEFNNESCNSCIFLQPRLEDTNLNLNFSQSILHRHVNVYKNGEIRKIRAKYISTLNPNWYVVFCGDYDTFELNGVTNSSTGLKKGFWGGYVNDMAVIKNVTQLGYGYEVYMVVDSFRENINGTKSFGINYRPSFSIYPNSEYYFNPDNK